MKLFRIPAGTAILVHDNSKTSVGTYPTENRTAKRDMVFELEDLRIDPLKRDCGRTIGDHFAGNGWYGFGYQDDTCGRTGYMVLVAGSDVEVL